MKKLKFVKTFEMYESDEWQGQIEDGDELEKIVAKRKIDKDFEIKAESIANLIINCPEFSKLKQLALDIKDFGPWEGGEGAPTEYLSELDKCFPTLDLQSYQIVNTGTKIPFYGRTKNLIGDEMTEYIYLPIYIAQKIKNPKYKY